MGVYIDVVHGCRNILREEFTLVQSVLTMKCSNYLSIYNTIQNEEWRFSTTRVYVEKTGGGGYFDKEKE